MTKVLHIFGLIIFCFLLFTSCDCDDDTDELKATAIIVSKNDSGLVGNVVFSETDGIVTMVANVFYDGSGHKAIHIHEKGDCSAADGTSAGGHWNPTNVSHGAWGSDSFHIGDIGNIVVGRNGHGSIERKTDLWCIGCDDETKNILGKAIIIHEGPDDFSSQPSGAAGPRIGCGEILKN